MYTKNNIACAYIYDAHQQRLAALVGPKKALLLMARTN